MKALPLRIRLTIWYSLIFAVSLGIFSSAAYFAMSHSIRSAVDAGLQRRVAGIRGIIASTAPEGLAALKDELNEFDEGQGNGGRLRLADSSGRLIYASPGIGSLWMRGDLELHSHPFYAEIHREQFRILRAPVEANGRPTKLKWPLTRKISISRSTVLERLLYLGVPLFLALRTLGGYWMSQPSARSCG